MRKGKRSKVSNNSFAPERRNNNYENLILEACSQDVIVIEKKMPERLKGLYSDNVIYINQCIQTITEKTCILAEEIGHYHTTVGDILDQTELNNRKQERRAREWANQHLIPLMRIIEACNAGIEGRHNIAEFLGVTEDFLQHTIVHYQRKYGLYAAYGQTLIYFEPLSVTALIE
ncbi:ImmA/IrrE family metallo-endopeptidase [Paenibacillus sp. L3-i20]|uniref:ImmA/IrrE family metallo-endopeptidase n=1 Tax=Paenibacillus sp. L3-i20 TaxID=2905833 RepID=UPI001EDE5027|nr:ImmA/IrrE family metallo-endopeptidase [Paenibacillus sp. L3-i20]GKU75664.1 membrane protein [Paenibacillus sp. L3-i20]